MVEEGTKSAVAAASHPQCKLRWLACLEKEAQNRVLEAIRNAIASCFQRLPSEKSVMEVDDDDDDDFDFGPAGAAASVVQASLDVGTGEAEFRRFCEDKKKDLLMLHAYPNVKLMYLQSNTLLPSSAAVEKMFSFATMFDISKFNRLTDANFEKRILCKANAVWATRKSS